MSEQNGAMYNVHYLDCNGKKCCIRYYATSKKDAERQFNEDKDVGEVIQSIKKAN